MAEQPVIAGDAGSKPASSLSPKWQFRKAQKHNRECEYGNALRPYYFVPSSQRNFGAARILKRRSNQTH